tara:strand:+ start:372 stop:1079 length:708 start_codon:yes stop_codon:yes gene_type:complete
MKHLLARGGIEFLAVLLGISGSLYIDDLQNQNEMKAQISKSMHALIGELNANSDLLSKLEERLLKDLPELDKVIKKDSIEYWTPIDLDKRIFKASTNWGRPLNRVVFNSIESSGLIYNIHDDSLRNEIINLYENTYSRFNYVVEYELTDIKKLDNIYVKAFTLKDDSLSTAWIVDWSINANRDQLKKNQLLMNHFIISRGNKRILQKIIPSQKQKTLSLINRIKNHSIFINEMKN